MMLLSQTDSLSPIFRCRFSSHQNHETLTSAQEPAHDLILSWCLCRLNLLGCLSLYCKWSIVYLLWPNIDMLLTVWNSLHFLWDCTPETFWPVFLEPLHLLGTNCYYVLNIYLSSATWPLTMFAIVGGCDVGSSRSMHSLSLSWMLFRSAPSDAILASSLCASWLISCSFPTRLIMSCSRWLQMCGPRAHILRVSGFKVIPIIPPGPWP